MRKEEREKKMVKNEEGQIRFRKDHKQIDIFFFYFTTRPKPLTEYFLQNDYKLCLLVAQTAMNDLTPPVAIHYTNQPTNQPTIRYYSSSSCQGFAIPWGILIPGGQKKYLKSRHLINF